MSQSGPPSAPPSGPLSRPPPGAPGTADLYAGKYQLVREIGRGGMGSVFEALEVQLDRIVAVKRMPPGGVAGNSLEARQRFRREVTAAARLTHPGVAQVLGFGTTEDGEHFIAMELVSGDNLRQELKQVVSAREVLGLFDQILAVLAYAHARGVVHSDLKPENILVTRVGAAPLCKLLDFGVARVETPAAPAAPSASSPPPPAETDEVVYGTPRYMAPEQVRGLPVGPAADLYGVGVMLYEALSGAMPISGRGESVMQRKLREPAPPLERTRFGAATSPELARVVRELLDRDPTTRLASAADARAALSVCPEAEARTSYVPPPLSTRPSDAPETVRVTRGATGLDPTRLLPFVGRRAERAKLADALAEVSDTGGARVVVLEGPTGIGKSHLLDWFVRQVREEGGRTVIGAAYLEAGGPEGDALRAAIERHIGAWGLGRQEVLRIVRRFLERHGGADAEEETALADLLRPDPARGDPSGSAEGRRTHALALMERTLRRIAAARPLVIALDELQWGGRAALEALSFFLAMWRQAPARVLCVATVSTPMDDRELRHAYRRITLHEGEQVIQLPLEPLGPEDSDKLIAAVMGDRGAHQIASIAGRAAGNPLFAIQLARLAREAGEPVEEDSSGAGEPIAGVVNMRRLGVGYLPASVQQLIEARLDAAIAHATDATAATHVLTEIAVLLPPVPTTLVELALAEDGLPVASAQGSLDQMVTAGILREVLHDGVEAIEFSHPLLGEVLRNRVSHRMLRTRSAQALALKEAYYAANSDRVLHELAEHAYHAGLTERARELGLAAAQQAVASGRYGDGVHLVSRLIEAERARPSNVKTEVALLASRIADEAGDARFAEGPLTLAMADDDSPAMEAALALARLHARVGRLVEATRTTDRAEAISAALRGRGEPASPRLEAEVLRLRASIARREGRFGDAISLLERVLPTDPDAGPNVARLVHDNLAWARHHAGDAKGALEAAEQALALSTPGVGRGWSLRTVSVIGRDALPIEERRQHLERALSIARAVGALRLLASALTHLGDLERLAGNTDLAADCFRQVLQIGRDHVDHEDLSEALANLAMMLLEEQRPAEAGQLLGARHVRRSSWELALRLVAAAAAAARGETEHAVAEVLAIRSSGPVGPGAGTSVPPPDSTQSIPPPPPSLRSNPPSSGELAEIPSSWGVARALERLASVMTELGREELATWCLTQAASAWSRVGEREASARVQALLAESSEPTLETTQIDEPG